MFNVIELIIMKYKKKRFYIIKTCKLNIMIS